MLHEYLLFDSNKFIYENVMENKIIIHNEIDLQSKIYTIRGMKYEDLMSKSSGIFPDFRMILCFN